MIQAGQSREDISEELGRSVTSISCKVHRIAGLQLSRAWNQAELRILNRAVRENTHPSELASLIPRAISAIAYKYWRVRKLNLSKKKKVKKL